jgi:HAD superfamily hydrolase (TIGR01458 family)
VAAGLKGIEGLLLDVDGVIAVDWEPLPGAVETIAWLRRNGIPFLLMTNATSDTRENLAGQLRAAGFDVRPDEIITSVIATAAYLRSHHPAARCFLLGERKPAGDLEGIDLVEEGADVVIVPGPDDAFTWENVNRAFRMLMDGALLVAMHRNLYWMTTEGLKIDAGAYVAGLEAATGVEAEVCGKPSRAYFAQAVEQLGIPAARVAMVGDDIEADVLAAQAAGLTGVLVRTGKFGEEAVNKAPGEPDLVIDSVADLPRILAPPETG